MNRRPFATIINFCTNEACFIRACIEQCRIFSHQIIIPVCDHFFDGTPENRQLLEQIFSAFPDCLFIYYPFAAEKIPPRVFRKIAPSHFWHSASRALGYRFLSEEIETILFLDADEIPDGRAFLKWLEESDYTQHSVLKLATYWYFREPRYRATSWETAGVLVQRAVMDPALLLHERERDAIYDELPGPKKKLVPGLNGVPLFHHYSWVRTQDEMMKKVEQWGHRHDRNWKELVKEEFSRPFNGTDFIHGYTYQECVPSFQISLEEVSFAPDLRQSQNVKRIQPHELPHLLGIRSWRHLISWFIR